jgi:hypothetical protein
MPPRSEEELDPVTLHNQALMNMDEHPTQGFEKLQFLLQQVPCPPETFANLLLLYVKFEVICLLAVERSRLTVCSCDTMCMLSRNGASLAQKEQILVLVQQMSLFRLKYFFCSTVSGYS